MYVHIHLEIQAQSRSLINLNNSSVKSQIGEGGSLHLKGAY